MYTLRLGLAQGRPWMILGTISDTCLGGMEFPGYSYLKTPFRASLVAQWLRIRLPMQGTRVRALVWEDPTCHGATRPVRHNY